MLEEERSSDRGTCSARTLALRWRGDGAILAKGLLSDGSSGPLICLGGLSYFLRTKQRATSFLVALDNLASLCYSACSDHRNPPSCVQGQPYRPSRT